MRTNNNRFISLPILTKNVLGVSIIKKILKAFLRGKSAVGMGEISLLLENCRSYITENLPSARLIRAASLSGSIKKPLTNVSGFLYIFFSSASNRRL